MKPYPQYKDSGVEWLGEIPEGWEVKKLKNIGEALIGLTYEPSSVVDETDGILVLRSSNVQGESIVNKDNVYVKGIVKDRLKTKLNDILICARNGSKDLVGKNGLIDQEFVNVTFGAFMLIFRSRFNKFLFRVFNSNLFDYQSGSFSTTTINQLTVGNIYSFLVPFPPLDEQKVIATFLDRETAKIDTLIAKQEQLISLLEEKRQALISHAVTKGLDPNAKMKDSGVEWLGEIPEGWEVKLAKRMFRARLEKSKPNDPQLAVTQLYGVIPQDEFIKKTGKKVALAINGTDSFRHVEKNDFVISLRSFEGGIEFSLYSGSVSPAYSVLCSNVKINYNYFTKLFKCLPFIIALRSLTDSLRDGKSISYENFSKLFLPFPPISQQKIIADQIDNQIQKIELLKTKTKSAIELLKEKRSALISSTVTGKIDVREMV